MTIDEETLSELKNHDGNILGYSQNCDIENLQKCIYRNINKRHFKNAKFLFLNFEHHSDLKLLEINNCMALVTNLLSKECDIIWSGEVNEKLAKNEVRYTILLGGL